MDNIKFWFIVIAFIDNYTHGTTTTNSKLNVITIQSSNSCDQY